MFFYNGMEISDKWVWYLHVYQIVTCISVSLT